MCYKLSEKVFFKNQEKKKARCSSMYFLNPRTLKAEDELSLSVQGQPELHGGFQTSPGYLLRSYLKQQQQKVCGGG